MTTQRAPRSPSLFPPQYAARPAQQLPATVRPAKAVPRPSQRHNMLWSRDMERSPRSREEVCCADFAQASAETPRQGARSLKWYAPVCGPSRVRGFRAGVRGFRAGADLTSAGCGLALFPNSNLSRRLEFAQPSRPAGRGGLPDGTGGAATLGYSLTHTGRRPGVCGAWASSMASSICLRSPSTRLRSFGSSSPNSSAAMS